MLDGFQQFLEPRFGSLGDHADYMVPDQSGGELIAPGACTHDRIAGCKTLFGLRKVFQLALLKNDQGDGSVLVSPQDPGDRDT